MPIIQHNRLTISKETKTYLNRVLNTEWIAQGEQVKSFENEICNFLNLPKGHAVAVSSCSMAMYVSLIALNAKNKSVGIPVYVSRVLRGAIGTLGAKEILYDIGRDDPNIDMDKVSINPPNILIIPHMYGIPVDLKDYKKSIVIENCAHAFGAKVRNQFVGLQKDVGVLSFQATKLITTGGMGGMVISKNKKIINKVRNYRDFDNSKKHSVNLNIKMTDLQASMGRLQLKNYQKFIIKRERIFSIYNNYGLNLLGKNLNNKVKPVRYRAVVKTNSPKKLINFLKKKKINTIVPIEKWELLSKDKKFKNALNLSKTTVSLPIYPKLSLKNATLIGKLLKKI